MKKFIITLISVLVVLAALFTYVLYTEGVFDTLQDTPQSELEPFQMKCEAGKCSAGKCASGKPSAEKPASK
jgi:uncharacterized ion transporter superfamily protein YfcC